jgi:hypothetical protein
MDLLPAAIWYARIFRSDSLMHIPHLHAQNPTVKAARKGTFKGSIKWLIKQLQ